MEVNVCDAWSAMLRSSKLPTNLGLGVVDEVEVDELPDLEVGSHHAVHDGGEEPADILAKRHVTDHPLHCIPLPDLVGRVELFLQLGLPNKDFPSGFVASSQGAAWAGEIDV